MKINITKTDDIIEIISHSDTKVLEVYEKLDVHFERIKLIIHNYDCAVALAYDYLELKVPVIVSFAKAYPHFQTLMKLAKDYNVVTHFDSELATKYCDICLNEPRVSHVIPREDFTEIARLLIAYQLTGQDDEPPVQTPIVYLKH